jgi:hypothetical protein
VCHFRNGDYYEGGWEAGLRHGRGMQQCTDGSNFVGGYCRGRRAGLGIYSFPNGDRYEGECAGDAPHGRGVYRFADCGAVYEGGWAAGAKHGWCVFSVGAQQSYGEPLPPGLQPTITVLSAPVCGLMRSARQAPFRIRHDRIRITA